MDTRSEPIELQVRFYLLTHLCAAVEAGTSPTGLDPIFG